MDTQSAATNALKRLSSGSFDPRSFGIVDGIAYAAERRRSLSASEVFSAAALGPLMELIHLSQDGLVPPLNDVPWLVLANAEKFYSAVCDGCSLWLSSDRHGSVGLFRVSPEKRVDGEPWFKFANAAKEAAERAGFHRETSLQLAAALVEVIDNVQIHSEQLETGIAAFRSRAWRFEFSVFDRGVGVLSTLRQNPDFSYLKDHGDALELALKDGYSKFGPNSNHGHGFKPLFKGLSNLKGSLRFRSGDHALTIDGRNPMNIPWQKAAKAPISGFFVSVSCDCKAR